jgi:CheY-like chemotaxis protein
VDAIRVLTLLIKAQGHQVTSAQSGLEGLELVSEFQPSFVFLDLGMPEMDGFETARRIRELPMGRDIQLVALTGWGQEEQRARTREAGFDQHLVKPVDSEVLQKMLEAE